MTGDLPFDIPDSWEWVRLGDVITLLSGQDFEPSGYNDLEKGIPYITGASNIDNGQILINRWTENPRCIAHKNDLLLVCKGAGVGKMAFLTEDQVHIARQIMSLSSNQCNLHFIQIFLLFNLDVLRQNMLGVIPGISRSIILSLLCPLPPLSEQQRIVEKIEALMPMINAL